MVARQTLEQQTAPSKPLSGQNLFKRRMPIGAELTPDGVHFRVWAPASKNASVQLISRSATKVIALEPEPEGYLSGLVPEARANMLYKFQLDSGAFPDPASRFQPDGPN